MLDENPVPTTQNADPPDIQERRKLDAAAILKLLADPDAKITMDKLLFILDLRDDGYLELTYDQEKMIARRLSFKVDDYEAAYESYYDQEKVLVFQAKLLEERANGLRRAAEQARKRADKVYDLLVWNMQYHQFEKLAGVTRKVKLSQVATVELNLLGEPTSEDFRQNPDLVKREYSWLLNPLKAAIKSDPEKWKKYGKQTHRPQLYWSHNKEKSKP